MYWKKNYSQSVCIIWQGLEKIQKIKKKKIDNNKLGPCSLFLSISRNEIIVKKWSNFQIHQYIKYVKKKYLRGKFY